MTKYTKLILFCGLICIGIMISSCSKKSKVHLQKESKNTLVFSLGGEVSILNPILSADSASSAVEGPIFNGLTKVNEKLEIIPDLAKTWAVSKDGLTYTFYLRKNVFWHDGTRFTSRDVVFTFNSILNPKVNSVRRSDYIIDGQPIKYKALTDYIVQVVLPKPYAPFLAASGISILPRHKLFRTDINSSSFNQHPIGTGPFMFKEWIPGDRVELIRNPNYFRGRPMISKIIYKIIPDENSRLIALEAGEADESDIPPKDLKRVRTLKNINVYKYDDLVYVYLGFNLSNPIFSDKKIRQAFAYATDKKQLVNLIFMGLASPAYSPASPISWAYEKNVNKYEFNVKKANKLLDEAGWRFNKNGIREKNGKFLEFTILASKGNKEREKAAVILEWQYKKIGAKVNIRILEWSALLKIINSSHDPKEFDAVIIGWSLGIDPDQYSIWHSSQYPNGLNFIKYNNKTIDRLLESGRTTIDKAARKVIYGNIQKIIADDQPYLFLWHPKAIVAVSKKIGGLSNPGPAGLFLNIEKVFIKK